MITFSENYFWNKMEWNGTCVCVCVWICTHMHDSKKCIGICICVQTFSDFNKAVAYLYTG